MAIPTPPGVDPNLFAIAEEFMRFTYDLLGTYFDALGGLTCDRERLIQFQNDTITRIKSEHPAQASEEFMDTQPLSHEFDADQHGPQKLLHRSTQGEFKRRTAVDGLDARILGYMMVALLYGAWEDKYRLKLALALGHSEKKALKSDLFGDLANLRHAIVHNAGVATEEVQRSKTLQWFQRGDLIFITSDQIDGLYDQIDRYITELCGIPTNFIPHA